MQISGRSRSGKFATTSQLISTQKIYSRYRSIVCKLDKQENRLGTIPPNDWTENVKPWYK